LVVLKVADELLKFGEQPGFLGTEILGTEIRVELPTQAYSQLSVG